MNKKFTIALDLEGTLISNAVSQFPRPGLYAFLEACKELGKVVIYTTVDEPTFRRIACGLVKTGEAPEWFADVEYIDWPQQGYKDLNLIAGTDHVVLIDDHKGYVQPGQEKQWIPVECYDPYLEGDSELDNVLRSLELFYREFIEGLM